MKKHAPAFCDIYVELIGNRPKSVPARDYDGARQVPVILVRHDQSGTKNQWTVGEFKKEREDRTYDERTSL